jgi:hypothetical protein
MILCRDEDPVHCLLVDRVPDVAAAALAEDSNEINVKRVANF